MKMMRVMTCVGRASALGVAASFATATLAGCGAGATTGPSGSPSVPESTSVSGPAGLSHGGPVRDHVSFVDRLRARGVRVDILSSVRRQELRPDGTRLRLTGASLSRSVVVESYNYDAVDLAADPVRVLGEDAAKIRTDGRLVVARADARGPWHWFRAERLLVAYLGSDESAIRLLSRVLGPAFADS